MKRLNLLFFSLCISFCSFSQIPVNGVVRDMYTHQPVPQTRIYSGSVSVTSNIEGQFSITLPAKSVLHITHAGYISRDININDSISGLVLIIESGNTSRNDIQVQAMVNRGNALNTPGAVETITSTDINRTNGIRLENSLNLLPGVRMERRTEGGGSRIVIRGYGNQSNLIGSGYKAYYNGIPLTDADGTTLLDDVDFATLGRVEVFKGPASGIYGAGIGGVVNMVGEKAPEGISVRQYTEAGSYGMLRTNSSLGIGTGQSNILVNYGRQLMDGYRLHSASKKDFLTFSGDFFATEKRTISFFFAYTKQLDQLAGQLNQRQLHAVPDTAELALLQNDANIEIENFRTGITQEYRFGHHFINKTTLFFSGGTIDQPSYTTLNKTNKSKFGGRTSFEWQQQIGQETAIFSAGAEMIKNINYQKSYGFTAGVLGTLRSDLEVKPAMYHVFSQVNLSLQEGTVITAGGSMNYMEYNIVDDRPALSGYVNTSGYKRFRPLFTPDFAISHFLNKNKTISFYAGYHVGYAPPATSQVVITQTGVVNTALNPEIAESFEMGTKGSLANGKLNYRIAFFNMDVRDKLVSQNFNAANGIPAYTITTNAGTVNGKGIELGLEYAYTSATGALALVRPFLSWTYNDFINVEYKSDNNNNSATKNYDGLPVSGIAKNVLNGGIDIEAANGLYLYFTDMYTGKMPIVNDRSEYAGAYSLVNGKIGWRKKISSSHSSRSWVIELFAGMDNITNQLYSPMISLNQTYIGPTPAVAGSSQALFFNPAPPKATWYSGCSLRISL